MSKGEIERLQDDLFALATAEIDAGNIDKAIEITIGCYFLSKGYGKEREEMALTLVYAAFAAYLQPDAVASDLRCSFCGTSGETARLGAGPNAYICQACVETFSEQFKGNQV